MLIEQFGKSLHFFHTGRGLETCRRIDRYLILYLWLHFPVALALSFFLKKSGLVESFAVALALNLLPTLIYLGSKGRFASRLMIVLSLAGYTMGLIHLSGGLIEAHFHVFVSLAIISSYRDFRLALVYAAVIAVHHIAFNFLLPYSLFAGGPNFVMVLLHAFFVIIETGYLMIDTLGRSNEHDFVVTAQQAAEEITSASIQVSEASSSLSANTSSQAASLEEIASSMTEIESQVRKSSENVVSANNLIREVSGQAGNGSNSMKALMRAMEELDLGSKSMFDIIKLIDSLAFQTNLLALNAAVEAARAGDSGKGFAVVAEEVRNLAGRSADAARQISEMITGSLSKVSESNSVAEESSAKFGEIIDGIQKVETLLSEISNASTDQTKGISEISGGISQLEKSTQQNAQQADLGASASMQLQEQVAHLNAMLAEFTSASVAERETRLIAREA